VFNKHDDLTVIIDNGTGRNRRPGHLSSRATNEHRQGNHSIVEAVKGIGIKWVKRTSTYDMRSTLKVLREALPPERGPKVIVADGECQLNRQRRVRRWYARQSSGRRVVMERFGIDPTPAPATIVSGSPAVPRSRSRPTRPAAFRSRRARGQQLRQVRGMR
jgi:indolepyruvate ferredoxin oxidoreductase alpha subunit